MPLIRAHWQPSAKEDFRESAAMKPVKLSVPERNEVAASPEKKTLIPVVLSVCHECSRRQVL